MTGTTGTTAAAIPETGPVGLTESSSSAVGKRRQAREMALQMLYQHELGHALPQQLLRAFDIHAFHAETAGAGASLTASKTALDYARTLLEGSLENREAIDVLISEQAENWRLERMSVIDRNILRLAVYELRHQRDVPVVVVINEAIDLAKKFGSDQSGRFVNGLLDALRMTLGLETGR